MVTASSPTGDDALLDAWFRQVQRDDVAKKKLADAIRAKNESALKQAVAWVFTNLVKPGAKLAWETAVKALVAMIVGKT